MYSFNSQNPFQMWLKRVVGGTTSINDLQTGCVDEFVAFWFEIYNQNNDGVT